MVRVVDPWHWLDEHGDLPVDNRPLRRQVLRVARLIEYGGPLGPGECRETLVECRRRPQHVPCPGLLWVEKTEGGAIESYCLVCRQADTVIHNWQDTLWADGPMEPLGPDADRPDGRVH